MDELGQQEVHSSQPDARRITVDPSRINPSVLSSTRRDQASVFDTGLGSAFKTTQAGNASNARHQTPLPGGPPPGGSDSNARHQISPGGPPQAGREVSLEDVHVIRTQQVKITC
jgi:hypothetical protein